MKQCNMIESVHTCSQKLYQVWVWLLVLVHTYTTVHALAMNVFGMGILVIFMLVCPYLIRTVVWKDQIIAADYSS